MRCLGYGQLAFPATDKANVTSSSGGPAFAVGFAYRGALHAPVRRLLLHPDPLEREEREPPSAVVQFDAPAMREYVTVGADALLTVKEAARRLEVSTATVYALCESGRLPHVRISTHSIRILRADLAGFVRSCLHGK